MDNEVPKQAPVVTTEVSTQNAATAQEPIKSQPANPGIIILQWLTYAFWFWTVLALSILTAVVLAYFLNDAQTGSFTPYAVAAVLVLLPISIVCDVFYNKVEPEHKTGAATVIMVIHAVLFALFAIGALISAVFSVVNLLTNSSTAASEGFNTSLYSSLIIMVFYIAVFLRTLNPSKFPFIRRIFLIFMSVTIGIISIASIIGPTLGERSTSDDRLISANIDRITGAMTIYMKTNTQLPPSLSNLGLKSDAKTIVDRNLVEYKPNTNAPSTETTSYLVDKYHYYELCVNYKKKSNYSESPSYNNTDYEEYISTYNHPSGNVCYKVKVLGQSTNRNMLQN